MEAKIYNVSFWIDEVHPQNLFSSFQSILEESGYIILNFIEHHFQPQGYTCLWLLAESHLAIHTFPESKKTYIELSSCNHTKQNTFLTIFHNRYIPII